MTSAKSRLAIPSVSIPTILLVLDSVLQGCNERVSHDKLSIINMPPPPPKRKWFLDDITRLILSLGLVGWCSMMARTDARHMGTPTLTLLSSTSLGVAELHHHVRSQHQALLLPRPARYRAFMRASRLTKTPPRVRRQQATSTPSAGDHSILSGALRKPALAQEDHQQPPPPTPPPPQQMATTTTTTTPSTYSANLSTAPPRRHHSTGKGPLACDETRASKDPPRT